MPSTYFQGVKNDDFRFSQCAFQSCLDIEFWCKIVLGHMKDPGIGGSQAFMREKNERIFLTIGDTPINVHIERKLKISRF